GRRLRRGVRPARTSAAQLVALAVHLQGPRIVARACQGCAQVAVGFGVVGVEPDRLTVSADGIVQLPLVTQGLAESVAEFGDHDSRSVPSHLVRAEPAVDAY